MKLPRKLGPIHFVGIGGIGMSGIAEVLCNLGYAVQGSDTTDSANVKRLREHGIKVMIGHDANNLDGAEVIVVSSAIKRDNPELAAARAKRLPVVRRAEMLAELMRLKSCVAVGGTHGKTTTTSLVASLLDAGGFDPTVINGGIINAYGTNARARRAATGWWWRRTRSDGTFLKLPANVAIVTNIDPEHLDHFGDFDAVKNAFHAFVENVPFYGFAVMCTDHPVVQDMVGRIEDRRIVTYGENPQADARLVDFAADGAMSKFGVLFRGRDGNRAHALNDLVLPMPGRHNALNATAAIAVAHELGVPDAKIREALARFGGVKRRFTRTGEWNGVTVFDDYGHHPVEIAAVLKAARASAKGHVIAVVQPHRYTRLRDLFEQFCTCFNDADQVIVAPVYPAGEARDPRRRPRRAGAGPAHARPPPRDADGRARRARGNRARHGAAGRLRDFPRRRLHHAVGLRAAGRACGQAMSAAALAPDLMATMPELRGRVLPSQPMANITWFRVGGPAEILYSPADESDLSYLLEKLPREVPVTVVGLGSNLLVRDGGVRGVVIRLGRGFNEVYVEGKNVRAGAAVPDVKVARAAADAGLAGLAFYRGVPGAIGGALRMNAGAYGRETKDALIEARAVHRSGEVHVFQNADMGFRYRHSRRAQGFHLHPGAVRR